MMQLAARNDTLNYETPFPGPTFAGHGYFLLKNPYAHVAPLRNIPQKSGF